jgi:hypothetical protein
MRDFLIDAAGSLILFALFWFWLGIPVAEPWQLALTAVGALILAAFTAYLAGFAFTRDLKLSLQRIPAYLVWLLLLAVALLPIWWLSQHTPDAGLVLGSWLTYQMRIAIDPADATEWLNRLLLFAAAAISLLFACPAAARIGERGFGAIREWKPVLKAGYLAECVIYVLLGLIVPVLLFRWIPAAKGLGLQLTSLTVRLLIAFMLFVACWLEFTRRCRRQTLTPEN